MANSSQIVALVIGLTVAAVFFVPIVDSINDNTGEIDIEDEEILDVTTGETYDLDGFSIVDGSETVEFDDGTGWVEATEGTDYEIDNDAGELTILEDGEIADGDDVRSSYTYEATDGTTTVVAGIIPVLVALLLLIPMANYVQRRV